MFSETLNLSRIPAPFGFLTVARQPTPKASSGGSERSSENVGKSIYAPPGALDLSIFATGVAGKDWTPAPYCLARSRTYRPPGSHSISARYIANWLWPDQVMLSGS